MTFIYRLRDRLSGHEKTGLWALAALQVAVCWLLILRTGNQVISLDEPAFLAIAQNLAETGVFANAEGEVTAYRAPGMAFFLTPFVWLGLDLVGLRMVNAVLTALTLILLFHIVRRHAGPLAGLLAAVLVLTSPPVIYAATTLYPQTLGAFLLVAMVWALDRLHAAPSAARAFGAGLIYGLLVLTIPAVLLLSPFLAFWLLRYVARPWQAVMIFALTSAMLSGLWTVRNYVVFDAFVPVATSSGYNLIFGNAPAARYDSSLDVRLPAYVYEGLTGLSEVEGNSFLTHAALQEIAADPRRAARLYMGKFLHWFDFSNTLLSEAGTRQSSTLSLRDTILLISWCLLVLPLAIHLLMQRRAPLRAIEWLAVGLWIGAGLAYAIFFTRIRFRMPFDWLIYGSNAIFIAALIEQGYARWRAARSDT